MFDVFSNWMFLKFMAVSDKISKEIPSPPHPSFPIYNTLITAAERHQGQSCPPTSLTNHSSQFRRCTFSQESQASPSDPSPSPPPPLYCGESFLPRCSAVQWRGLVKQPLIFLQCVIFRDSDFTLSLQVFRKTHCTLGSAGQTSETLEDEKWSDVLWLGLISR